MPKTTRQMPSFQGVDAGQTATLNLPIGQTYHQLLIAYSGVKLDQITGLRVVVNGRAIQTYRSADIINTMNLFDGRTGAGDSGILVVDFERYGMEGRTQRELTAMGTGNPSDPTPIDTMSIEVDIAGDASGPALSCKAVRSAPKMAGVVKKVRRYTYNPTGAGDFEIADLPKNDLINQVFFFGPGINKLELSRDNYQEFVRSRAENNLIQTNGIRNPQSGVYVYDPTENGNGSETLATKGVQDLRFSLDMAGAATLDVVVVYLGSVATA